MNRPRLVRAGSAMTAAALCLTMAIPGVIGTANAVSLDDVLSDVFSSDSSDAGASTKPSKDETVYVTTEPDGSVSETVVNDELKNADRADRIEDVSELDDIKTVGEGSATYTSGDGGRLTWEAAGKDVQYQGSSSKDLPVDMRITYKLDGERIEPADLAGKSGRVKIHIAYANKSKSGDVHTPFVMVTGLILSNDLFTHVRVSSGKVISDGDRTIVVALAMPGLADDLDVSEKNLPGSVDITADATDFELGNMVTLATSSLFAGSDSDDSDDDLSGDIDKLTEVWGALVDGAGSLSSGLDGLADATTAVSNGMQKLDSGAGKLKKGATVLSTGAAGLDSGAETISAGASKLKGGTEELYKAAKGLPTTAEQLALGASSLAQGISGASSGVTKLTKNEKKLNAAIKNAVSAVGSESDGDTLLGGNARIASLLQDVDDALSGADNALGSALSGSNGLNGAAISSSLKDLKDAYGNLSDAEKVEVDADGELGQLVKKLDLQSTKLTASSAEVEDAADDVRTGAGKAQGGIDDAEDALGSIDTTGMTDKQKDKIAAAREALQTAGSGVDDVRDAAGSVDDAADAVSDAADTVDDASQQADDAGRQVREARTKLAAQASSAMEDFKSAARTFMAAVKRAQDNVSDTGNLSGVVSDIERARSAMGGARTGSLASAIDESKQVGSDLSQLSTDLQSVQAGHAGISSGLQGIAPVLSSAATGAGSLAAGTKALSDSAPTLVSGIKTVKTGTKKLSGGADSLATGAGKLSKGAKQLSSGMAAFVVGTGKLAAGTPQLARGMQAASKGSLQLSQGLKALDEEVVQKLTDALDGDLGDISDKLEDLADAGKAYTNFSGIHSGMDGSVQFIYRTISIKSSDE